MFNRRSTDSVSATDMRDAKDGVKEARSRAADCRRRGETQLAAVHDRAAANLATRAADIKANRIDAGITRG